MYQLKRIIPLRFLLIFAENQIFTHGIRQMMWTDTGFYKKSAKIQVLKIRSAVARAAARAVAKI
jgi:hypothetical protein